MVHDDIIKDLLSNESVQQGECDAPGHVPADSKVFSLHCVVVHVESTGCKRAAVGLHENVRSAGEACEAGA